MEIKVLGSGSTGNCYHVSDGRSSLLIEAGLPFKKIQRGIDFKISELSGLLVSHEHGDHSKSVKDMLNAGVQCLTGEGTAKALNMEPHYRLITLTEGFSPISDWRMGSFSIQPFRIQHDAADPLGFVLTSRYTGERLLYASDTCYLKYRFDGLTTIMIEVNYCRDILDANVANGSLDPSLRNRIVQSHMSLDTALDFFRANDLSKVTEIIILHLSDSNSQADRIKTEVQKLTGKVVKIA
jgi:phosphoribosyl 1,2-cyclic phosphodiesterase